MKKYLLLLATIVFVSNSHAAINYYLNESFESGIPATWTQQVLSDEQMLWTVDNESTYPTGAFEGSQRVALRNSSGVNKGYITRLITPPLDISSVVEPRLSFAYALPVRSGFHDTLTVYFRSNANAEWTLLRKYTGAQNRWKQEDLGLVATYGQAIAFQLAFEAKEWMGRGVILDDIRIYPKSQCDSVSITGVIPASHSVQVLWSGDMDPAYEVLLDTVAIADPSSYDKSKAVFYTDNADGYDAAITIPNIAPSPHYHVYVRATCADNETGYTNWASAQFATMAAFPYTPSFQDSLPNMWERRYGKLGTAFEDLTATTNYYGWQHTTYNTLIGKPHVYGRPDYTSSTYKPGWLMSPLVDLEGVSADSIELSFRLGVSYSATSVSSVSDYILSASTFHVLFSTDEGHTWVDKDSILGIDLDTIAEKFTVDMTPYKGHSVRVAFVVDASSTSVYFHMGDVRIEAVDPNCAGIRKLHAAPSNNSVDLSWNVRGTNYNALVVLSSSPNFTDTIQALHVTRNNATINGLIANSHYYVSVQQECEKGNTISTTFHTDCEPITVVFGEPWTENFDALPSGTLSIDCWANEHISGSGSSLFSVSTSTQGSNSSNTLSLPDMSSGTITLLSLPVIYMEEAGAYAFQLDVYRNSSFATYTTEGVRIFASASSQLDDNAVELAFVPRVYSASGVNVPAEQEIGWYTYEFDIPVQGNVHIFVRGESKYGAATYMDNFQVRHLPPCRDMKTVSVVATRETGVTLSFPATNAPQYQLVIATENINPDTYTSAPSVVHVGFYGSNRIVIDDASILSPNTTYYAYVRGYCDEQEQSTWSNMVSFHTQCTSIHISTFGVEDFAGEHADCWSNGYITKRESETNAHAGIVSDEQYGNYMFLSHAAIDTITHDGAYAVSPKLEFADGDNITNYQITFSAATISQLQTDIHRLVVAVVFDPNDFSFSTTMKVIDLNYAADSTEVPDYTVSFANYQGYEGFYGQYILFAAAEAPEHDSTSFVLLDNIMFEPASNCDQIIETSISDITTHSALFSWENKNVPEYEVMVSTTRSRQPATITDRQFSTIVSNSQAQITDLQSSTRYYAYVRAICGEGDTAKWSNPISFATSIAVPYLETFDYSPNIPTGWQSLYGSFAADSVRTANLSAPSGNYKWSVITDNVPYGMEGNTACGYINDYYYGYPWLITPIIDLSENVDDYLEMTFLAARSVTTSSTARFYVVISTDGGQSWSKDDAVSWMSDGDYSFNDIPTEATQYHIPLTKYAGEKIAIAFYMQSPYGYTQIENRIYIDSIDIHTYDAICMGVSDIKVVPDGQSANVSWYIEGVPVKVQVEISDNENFETIIESRVIEDEFATTFNDLQFRSTYYIRIKQLDCAQTEWVKASFNTPIGVPYAQSFNLSSLAESGWSLKKGTPATVFKGGSLTDMSSPSSYGWNIYSYSYGLPANHLRINIYSSTSGEWVVSPVISMKDVHATDSVVLSFDFAYTNYNTSSAPDTNADQALFLLVSEDGGASWKQTNAWEWSHSDSTAAVINSLSTIPTTGQHIEIDFSRFAGKTIQIAFAATSIAEDNDFHIANVSLIAIDLNCLPPTSLSAIGGENSLMLSWQGDKAKQTKVELSLDESFSKLIDTHIVDTGLCDTIYNLQPGTKYYARVRQLCEDDKLTDYSNSASAFTSCGIITSMPWTEGFENYDVGSRTSAAPYCWDLLNANGVYTTKAHYVYVSDATDYIHSGNHSLYFQATTADYAYAILPQIETLNQRHLSFYYTFGVQQSGSFDVGYITDITSTSTFVSIAHIANQEPYKTPKYISLYLDVIPDDVPDTARLAIRYGRSSTNASGASIDDICISNLPSARPVENIVVDEVGMHSAQVNFTIQPVADKYQLILTDVELPSIQEGFSTQDSLHILRNDSNIISAPFLLDNLQSASGYYAYMRAIASDGPGEWSEAVSFLTQCGPISSLPWSEDFEQYTTDATFDVYCWSNQHVAGRSSVVAKVAKSTSVGNTTQMLQIGVMSNGNKVMVTTPQFAIDQANAFEIRFDAYRKASTKPAEGLKVYASLSDTIDESAQLLAFIPYGIAYTYEVDDEVIVPAQDAAGMYSYSFAIPLSGDVRILFEYAGSGTAGGFYMDNFVLRRIPLCADLTGLKAIEVAGRSAVVTVDSLAWGYNVIAVSEPINPDTLDNVSPELIPYNQILHVDTFNINNLQPLSTYYIYARTLCEEGYGYWAKPITITTDCGAINNFPFTEGFENMPTGSSSAAAPQCWALLNANKGYTPYVYVNTSSSYVHSGSKSLYFVSSSSRSAYAILPELENLNNLQIEFSYKHESTYGSGVLSLGYMTDITSESSFVAISTYERSTTWQTISEALDVIPDDVLSSARLAFRYGSATNNYYMGIDDINISQLPSCRSLTKLDVQTTDTSAIITFASSNEGALYQVITANTSITPSAVDGAGLNMSRIVSVDTVADVLDTVYGLNARTKYYVYVRALCDETDKSEWKSMNFTTDCGSIKNLPWTEGFESMARGSAGGDAPQCWAQIPQNSSSPYSYVNNSSSYVRSGTQSLYFGSSGTKGIFDILPLFAQPLNNLQIEFSYKHESLTSSGHLSVGYVTSITDSTTFVSLYDCPMSTSWKTVVVSLEEVPETIASSARIAFRYSKSTSSTAYWMGIDDIKVSVLPTCRSVTSLNAIPSDSSAIITFNSSHDGAVYQVISSTTSITPSDIDGVGLDMSRIVSIDTVAELRDTLLGLSAQTKYFVYVRTLCDDIEHSDWQSMDFTTDCGMVSVYPWTEGFESMQTGSSLSDAPQCWALLNANDGSYPYVYVNTTATYVHSGSKSLYFVSSSNRYAYAILPPFADLNNLQIQFSFKDESATSSGFLTLGYMTDITDTTTFKELATYDRSTLWQTVTESLDRIPSDVLSSARLAFRYGGATNNYYMGIDDITISVLPTCHTPQNLHADVSDTAAIITFFSSHDQSVQYQVITASSSITPSAIDGAGLDMSRIISIDTISQLIDTIHGLSAQTTYYSYVRVLCNAIDHSEWNSIVYTTACAAAELPYIMTFENELNNYLPSCWSVTKDGSSSYPYVYNGYANTGSKSLVWGTYYSYSAQYRSWVSLPILNGDISSLEMSFYLRSAAEYVSSYYSYSQIADSVIVGVMSDPSDASTFVPIQGFFVQSEEYEQFFIDFSSYHGEGRYIAFMRQPLGDKNSDGSYSYGYNGTYYYNLPPMLDDINVHYIPDCPSVRGLKAVNVAAMSATVGFNVSVAPQHEVVVTIAPINPDTLDKIAPAQIIQHAVIDENTLPLQGLYSNTSYYVYARNLCDASSASDWALTMFTTEYSASVPFEEDFNEAAIPVHWNRYSGLASSVFNGGSLSSTSSGWVSNSTVMGSVHPKINIYGEDAKYWLTTPAITLTTSTDEAGVELSFDVALTKYNQSTAPDLSNCTDDKFIVAISTDGGNTWSEGHATVWALDGSGDFNYANLNETPQTITIDLTEFKNQTVVIGFYGESTVQNVDNDLHIDNVSIHSTNLLCPNLSNLRVSNVMSSSVDFAFGYGDGVQEATVMISRLSVPDLATAIEVKTLTGDSACTFTGLDGTTRYYIYAARSCDNNGMSEWSRVAFSTAIGIPYSPVFTSTTMPSDWSRYSGAMDNVLAGTGVLSATSSGWSLTSADTVIASTHFKGNIYGSSFNYWLVTPMIDLTANVGDGVLLNFEAGLTPYSSSGSLSRNDGTDDRFAVLVSEDNGATWIKIAEWNNSGTGNYVYNDVSEHGTEYHLDLSSFAGKSIQVAFYGESTQSNADNNFHIGNINLNKCAALTFTKHIPEGDDYDGASDSPANDFYIYAEQTVVGLNVYSDYRPAIGAGDVDSMIILNLYVDTAARYTYPIAICEGEHYSDNDFDFVAVAGMRNPSRIYNNAGFDSIVEIQLLVNRRIVVHLYDSVLQGDAYLWHGENKYLTGDYTFDTVSVVSGCDSITVLHLHTYVESAIGEASTYKLRLSPNPAAIGQPVQVLNEFTSYQLNGLTIEVFTTSGELVLSSHGASDPLTIPGFHAAGLYLIRISDDDNVYISPLLVK